MTTNKPEVVAWYTPPARDTLPVVALNDRSKRGEPLIRLSDYDALQAECRIQEALEWLRGAINCTPENDKQKCGAWISTKHPRIRQIDELLATCRNKTTGNQFISDIAETEKERRLMRDVGALTDALAALHALNRLAVESLELFVSRPTPTSEDFDTARAALDAHRKQGGEA